MTDPILDSWWRVSLADAQQLADESDLLTIESLHERAERHLIARLACRGLVRESSGRIVEAEHFEVGVRIPPDYLDRAETQQVFQVLYPLNIWHPNVIGPLLCAGHLHPGMPIVDLLYQVHGILTYHIYASHDGLNADACVWARQPENRARFAIDRRPLKRRKLSALKEGEA